MHERDSVAKTFLIHFIETDSLKYLTYPEERNLFSPSETQLA